MKIICHLLFVALLAFSCSSQKKNIQVSESSVNGFATELPLIKNQQPRFSWKLRSDYGGTAQSAWQILVADDAGLLKMNEGNQWNSGKVDSKQSILIDYDGSALEAGKKYFWKVKVWDQAGNASAWSEIASFQLGLLSSSDWAGAQWIGYEDMDESKRLVEGVTGYGDLALDKVEKRAVVPLFRKSFDLTKKVASATLFISGVGQYEASLNGQKIGDDFLTPGWSDYDKTVFYNTCDVTGLLRSGENALGVMVGNGFHYNNRERYRKLIIAYGFPKMICKLQIQYADGTDETIVSGGDWQTKPSPTTYSGIYGGEDYDARLEEPGWNETGFDASDWKMAELVRPPSGELKADPSHPVKVMDTFSPVAVKQLNDTSLLYDFGQNASGIISLRLKGKAGQQVRFYPAESLKDDGTVSQRGSGSPYYYTYTLKGEAEESWQPRFTYYGFRYVQVNGAQIKAGSTAPELPEIMELKSLHTRNSAPTTGSFSCSNELFNRTFDLINWGIKSNLQSVMTDCPTREKLGWIEQTQLMGASVHFNFDLYHLYKKLLSDMADAQTAEGLVPSIVPEYINFEYYDAAFRDSPEWGSASIILPWMIYRWYGDLEPVQQAWPVMQRYMAYLESKANENILSHGLGDWYDVGPKEPGYAQLTPVPLVATAIYFYDAQLMAQMAKLLGNQNEAIRFAELSTEIKNAFNLKFYNRETATYATGSQTSLAMPLSLGLVDPGNEAAVLENLVRQIEADQGAITAGDVGFHFLVDVLTSFGKSELLYEMNNRDDVPGYGYQLKQGATSLAESWQALPSKSLNHLMLGHLMEWFCQGLGGIRQAEHSQAYREIVIQPEVVEELSFVKTSFDSPYGKIVSNWEKKDGVFTLRVEVPVNATAKVILPYDGDLHAEALKAPAKNMEMIRMMEKENGRTVCSLQSGSYQIELNIKQ